MTPAKTKSQSSSSLVQRQRPRNVCFVVRELYGWNSTTGTNQNMMALAQFAANRGDRVTLAWVPRVEDRVKFDEKFESWLRDELYTNHLIKLLVIDKSSQILPGLTIAEKASMAIYHHLKDADYDVVHFSLEGGLGYYSLLSSELGLMPVPSHLSVIASEPLAWQVEADKSFMVSTRQVAESHMERYCATAAQTLVCTSKYIRAWMNKQDWKPTANTIVLAPLVPFNRANARDDALRKARRVDELVFVNGLGERFGFQLFCDVVGKLADEGRTPKITVLGHFSKIAGEHTGGMLLRHARNWKNQISMIPLLSEDDQLAYLAERNCLLVAPFTGATRPAILEYCLNASIPFIATKTGGIPEMLDSSSRRIFLEQPNAQGLADKIASFLDKPIAAPIPALSLTEKTDAWNEYFEAASKDADAARKRMAKPASSRGTRTKKDTPLVSIILVHHDRPHMIEQAVESVEKQDYPNIELIIVDDGSKHPESLHALDRVEKRIRKRKGWRVLREPNRYLGAARNTGIRASKGERILFLDDDNALFANAVSTYVNAMNASRADICTAFSKLLYDPFIPASEEQGYIQYFPLGGSLDLALIHNSLGDANAMIKRELFDKVGFLIEDYGYTAQDWEFFTRALFDGAKLRIIPDPLYWYRSSTDSMWRSSNWYQNRLPILDVFRQNNFKGVDEAFHLLIGQNVSVSDTEIQFENLRYSISNNRHRELAQLEANSHEALELLSEIACAEGRTDTGIALLGLTQNQDFYSRLKHTLAIEPASENALVELTSPFSESEELDYFTLRRFVLASRSSSAPEPVFYIDDNSRLFFEADGRDITSLLLPAGCPAGTLAVTVQCQLAEQTSDPAEFIIAMLPREQDPTAALAALPTHATDGSSGWQRISRQFETRELTANLEVASSKALNLVIGLRCRDDKKNPHSLGSADWMSLRRTVRPDVSRLPSIGMPQHRQRSYAVEHDAYESARLITKYDSERPLLLVDRRGGGIFQRPIKAGPVIALLPQLFPPFAKRVIASVEIGHDEASDFEFAMALVPNDFEWNSRKNLEDQAEAFSSWERVTERFRQHQFAVEIELRSKASLSLCLAIRLPRGSNPDPSNAFWRKLVVAWDD